MKPSFAQSLLFSLFLSCSCLADSGEWIPLFNGKNLEGWKASENAGTFKVVDGVIVANGDRSHLFYLGDGAGVSFKNFEFSADVNAAAGANSGIYFHTAYQESGWPGQGFEVQVNNSAKQHGNYLELKKTGSLYGIRNIYKQLVPDDTWFTLNIRVQGRRVQVRLNNLLLVDYIEPQNAVAPSNRPGRQLGEGTFALQGHDPGSLVRFRNLRVRRLPEVPDDEPPVLVDEHYRQVLDLASANFPLVDLHTHLKGGLTLQEVLAHTRATGINHGIAVNCGLGFSVTNDAGIDAFLESVGNAPVFVGMQAEGREWQTLFSPGALKRFDYVFTDAMTIVDPQGRRSRLWMPDEVSVPDKQEFMECLVSTIEHILDNEPIDIYVNPTYLPEVIADEYDTLWTDDRKRRVIAAAVRNNVAIEISARLRLPKADFIKAAKKAGVKFTLGTNNPGREILSLDYALEMVRECGLKWQDMWMPE